MRFDVLGPLRVTAPAGQVRVPSGGSAKVVCWLLANLNQPVSTSALAAVLSPDPTPDGPAKAAALARGLVPVLGADRLEVGGHVTLRTPEETVDAFRFRALVADGLRQIAGGDLELAQAHLSAALDLWRGEPYPELERVLPAMATIDALVEQRLVAHEELVGIALRRRVDYPLVAELRSLVIRHAERPRLRTQLATALYRTGRQIEALDALAQARREHGDLPGYGRLQTAILQQDPLLADGELP
ncbi:AfsR/SARP family transcriptional regulator [Nocardioides sp. TF02-7]|uniref:AfsR/SARP family transcriptional regulator n=1 Tax=Nocardioides sp. TF02-7 TaxID=2917724 RepID=UPI001F0551AC|nr:AfsR/SARP family transcriptional regulator [Nocardioides sp. TF02-7]UMG94448.1 AfsR/SARP family transcriptional regulator [Nocardioides sp. TF02-7]